MKRKLFFSLAIAGAFCFFSCERQLDGLGTSTGIVEDDGLGTSTGIVEGDGLGTSTGAKKTAN